MRVLAIGECMVEMAPTDGPDIYRLGFAGDTFNTAWHIARLAPEGVEVGYVTAVGTDPLSDKMLAFMARSGIDTSRIRRVPDRRPGLYLISLDDGERSFTYFRDTSAARCLADDVDWLTGALADADMVFLSGITLAILPDDRREALVSRLEASGCRIAYDPNHRPALWRESALAAQWSTRLAALADIVMPGLEDELALSGAETPEAVVAHYLALGAREVVVKNGTGPMCAGTQDNPRITLPAPAPVTPIDTTGAGDSFNAAYLAARLTGSDIADAVSEGQRLAARVVQVRGGLL